METNQLQDFDEKITGKSILITGGTKGIGRATALLLSRLGNDVLICGRHEKELQDTLDDFEKLQAEGSLSGVIADLASEEGINQLFNQADEMLGGLDVLINNAALSYQSVAEGTYQDQEYLVKTNLLGYMACCQKAIERMGKSGSGHIVNVGSMSADVREEGSSVYVATKGGIQAFSEALRKEVNGKGIKVSLIEPGATGTNMQPMSSEEQEKLEEKLKMLKAEDVAAAIVYVLSQPERCDVVSLQLRPHLQKI